MLINFSTFKNKIDISWKDPLFIWTSRIGFLSIGANIVSLIIVWRKLPPQLPLFYSLPWGQEQLTNPFTLIIFLALTLLIYCLLLIGVLMLRFISKIYAQILTISATILVLMSVYAIIRIILLIV